MENNDQQTIYTEEKIAEILLKLRNSGFGRLKNKTELMNKYDGKEKNN